jgi:hypothetical protein
MEPNNVVPTRCASCNGHGLPQMFRPYCSVVCRTLGHAGLAWRTNPCGIMDIQSGALLSSGPEFDLTPRGLAQMQKQAERLCPPPLEQAAIIVTDFDTPHLAPQSPPFKPAFSGSRLGELL